MRIVSLPPSSTEIVCQLGLRDALVGVTHECDYPPFVAGLPKVTRTLIPHDASSSEIDELVRERLKTQRALYTLDLPTLERLRPDLIVTQALCDVCAVTDPLVTKRRPLAQLVFCQGCCCGRTDRGHPEVPVGRLKEVWKEEKLNRSVQLTISGCLGPCDLANVALVITPDGNEWFGGLAGEAVYESLIAWVQECHREERLVPPPAALDALRFKRFGPRGEGS